MKVSAGILLFKKEEDSLYYFLVHPGGPFWKNKDLGAWSIPKGEMLPDENPLNRALTEFKEETGKTAEGNFIELSPIKQKGGKMVYAWALEGEIDTSDLYSNTFSLEWPPNSGKIIEIPEVDQWEWFSSEEAQQRINIAQKDFITELENIVKNQ
ncbi:NUDIX domain-containing protein [Chryseobacterium sp.]|jgi:predicted NUDIX family NTP pyrophosphohydrolase|uniref:NUDIX hydrolase n=1 Tax=Chryseobacterium sp. TaxID=1871047 RepID=UPI002849D48A|nr:NUDIX domain-containing protein [Chryseobacterium sp.]MDR3023884.1 NUDIX domain-containing protein [Chryseobacterium sp.]